MKSKDAKKTKHLACRRDRWFLPLFFLIGFSSAFGSQQQTDTLRLDRQQYEELFLKQNLLLIAEKFAIDQADALLLQAKVWPNPSLSIDEVNLWSTKRQLASLDHPLPAVFGNTAKNTQFSLQIEQLIQTAGKRKKLIAMEQVSVALAKQQFEELLRNLKLEFRTSISRLQYLQRYQQVFIQQQGSVQNLLKGYQEQVNQHNVSKAEFIRLQALDLGLSKDISELTQEKNEVEAELKILLHVTNVNLYVQDEGFIPQIQAIKEMRLSQLLEQAMDARPDRKLADLAHKQYASLFQYQKAQRVPNLTLRSSYDRGGGIWPSFVGFGLAIDLPIFDRNQGNIKHAKLGMDQTKLLMDEKEFQIQAEVSQRYKDLIAAVVLYERIDPLYEQDLDLLLNSYTRNFISRNISLLEYLDFQHAYLENKKIILESQRDIHLLLEELHYTTGIEIK